MDAVSLTFLLAILALMLIFALVVLAVLVLLVRPWVRAALHGTPVSLIQVIAMRLRGNPPTLLIDAYITLQRAKVSATLTDVENVFIDTKNQITTSDDLVALVKQKSSAR